MQIEFVAENVALFDMDNFVHIESEPGRRIVAAQAAQNHQARMRCAAARCENNASERRILCERCQRVSYCSESCRNRAMAVHRLHCRQ